MFRWVWIAQGYDGGAPATGFGGSVLEGKNKGRASQHSAYNFALHTNSPPVDDAKGFQAQPVGLLEIGLNRFFDLLRPHGVQVENVGDGNTQWLFVVVHLGTCYIKPLTVRSA